MRELNYAINKSLKVVPIHLEPPEVLDLTTFLVGDLLYFDLASQSVLSAVGTAEWDNTMDKLADFIKSELYNSKIPPQPPQRRQAAEPKLLLPDKRDRPNHISGKILARTPSPMTKKAKEDPMQTLKSWLKPRSLLDLRLDEIRLSRCRNTRAWLLQEVEQWMTTSDERRKHLWLAGTRGRRKECHCCERAARPSTSRPYLCHVQF
ncbi:hypothetical protein DFJ73DRAFT_99101 [Zopfochytrium polystomum]|nr:hypothetical protein DFJ73DRAFT_99101 [Zopfochytrium polystomum]